MIAGFIFKIVISYGFLGAGLDIEAGFLFISLEIGRAHV